MYYLEVFFENYESIAIKSLIEKPTVEQLAQFLKKDVPKYGKVKKSHVISLEEVKCFFDTKNIENWPILVPDKKVEIRGAWIKQNYSTTGEPVKYGMKIEMIHSSEYYGEAYFYTSVDKVVIDFNYHFKTFSEASDKLSLAIIKHMIENPILVLG